MTEIGLPHLLAIALGGALGGMARHGLSRFVARRCGETFPWGTLAVNVSGCFCIGLLAGLWPVGGGFWNFAVIGVLGSYTTVSSFALQTHALYMSRQNGQAFANILLSVILCIASVALGYGIVEARA